MAAVAVCGLVREKPMNVAMVKRELTFTMPSRAVTWMLVFRRAVAVVVVVVVAVAVAGLVLVAAVVVLVLLFVKFVCNCISILWEEKGKTNQNITVFAWINRVSRKKRYLHTNYFTFPFTFESLN